MDTTGRCIDKWIEGPLSDHHELVTVFVSVVERVDNLIMHGRQKTVAI